MESKWNLVENLDMPLLLLSGALVISSKPTLNLMSFMESQANKYDVKQRCRLDLLDVTRNKSRMDTFLGHISPISCCHFSATGLETILQVLPWMALSGIY